jgi:hypothetical protein
MMLRSIEGWAANDGLEPSKKPLSFAFTQTRFPLGQVSYSEPGTIPVKKTEKWTVFTETLR